jgi:DNA-binding MarR family transcriptional regulator
MLFYTNIQRKVEHILQLEECLNYLFSRTQQSVLQLFRKELEPLGVTPVQYGVLNCLLHEDGCTASHLAERLGLDSSTITGILDRLEQKGLVCRVSDTRDRRALQLFLTEKGRGLKEDLEKVTARANKTIEERIPADQVDLLKKLLRDIAQLN